MLVKELLRAPGKWTLVAIRLYTERWGKAPTGLLLDAERRSFGGSIWEAIGEVAWVRKLVGDYMLILKSLDRALSLSFMLQKRSVGSSSKGTE